MLHGDPAPLPKNGAEPPPQFSANFYCAQTAGCITMPLGMEEGLNPGEFVFDGEPAPSLKRGGATSPIFGLWLLWPNGWMDQDGTWHGSGPWSRPHCARRGTSSPPPKRRQSPLQNFRPIFIVAKRLDESRWHLAWRWALVQATFC